jgi:hypothetical protein
MRGQKLGRSAFYGGRTVAPAPGFTPPLLLAGPVLRKVTPSAVYVWVATSQSCNVRLDVYAVAAAMNLQAGQHAPAVAATAAGTGSRQTVTVGGSLHVAVVKAPLPGVAPDTVCSYNVTLDVLAPGPSATFTGQWNLGGLKLLDLGDPSDDYQGGLGFAEGRLPTFLTPPEHVEQLRVMHGSCFSLKGDGTSMMPAIDDIISDALAPDTPPERQRPHLLMLTGDQIYADDLATSLLPALNSIGASLLGGAATEIVPIPGAGAGAAAASVPVDMDSLPAGRRLRLVRKTAGMTSDDGDDHLIGFGEFAAMYLLSWTGRLKERLVDPSQPLWPDGSRLAVLPDNRFDAPPNATDVPVVLAKPATPGPAESLLTPLFAPEGAGQLAHVREKFPITRRDMQRAGDDGDKVRRALANVPVLTICDDHEVTDDWFISGAWRARVLASPLGRAIIRNALLAYVLFQAWGNTPEAFDTAGTPEAQLLALVPQLFTGATVPDPDVAKQVDTLLGLDDPTGGGATPRVAFNYHLDVAGARLVVLDTRNHREYVTPDGPPGLLSQAALDAQLPISLTDDVPLLIVVSPAPVLGPRVQEEIIQPAFARGYDIWHLAFRDAAAADAAGFDTRKPVGDLHVDVENWAARPASFERFLARVSRCPRVVILAGDVHYAASYALDYQRFDVPAADGGVPSPDPPPPTKSSRIVNFTSSPIRNQWPYEVPALFRTIGLFENLEQVGFRGARLGWTRVTPPVFTGDDHAPDEPRPLRARLRREPVILPVLGWADPHTIRPPEWAYQVTPVSDTRSDDVRFADLAEAGFTQVLAANTPDAPLPDPAGTWLAPAGPYDVASTLHAANLDGGAVTRTAVFQNNVGLVAFGRPQPAGPLSVQMALYFVRAYPASVDEKAHAYVVHATQLEPVALGAPDHVGPNLSQLEQA